MCPEQHSGFESIILFTALPPLKSRKEPEFTRAYMMTGFQALEKDLSADYHQICHSGS